MEEDRVSLAVSLDIANAFNTLPWKSIGEALDKHRIPPYLVGVIKGGRDQSLFPGEGTGVRAAGRTPKPKEDLLRGSAGVSVRLRAMGPRI